MSDQPEPDDRRIVGQSVMHRIENGAPLCGARSKFPYVTGTAEQLRMVECSRCGRAAGAAR